MEIGMIIQNPHCLNLSLNEELEDVVGFCARYLIDAPPLHTWGCPTPKAFGAGFKAHCVDTTDGERIYIEFYADMVAVGGRDMEALHRFSERLQSILPHKIEE
jgi:hypothetical protein